MKTEQFVSFDEDQRKETASRIVSDAELIQGGASIKKDGSLKATEVQIHEAKLEMDEAEGRWAEKADVNGVRYSIAWDDGYQDYTIYFPGIMIGDAASKRGVDEQVLRISDDKELAKKVSVYVRQTAEQENDVYKLYKMTEKFIQGLQSGEDT